MKRYISIYKTLLRLNFSALVSYRANFINSVVSTLAWAVFSLFTVTLLTTNTRYVYGWSREELLILVGAYNIFIGVFHMLFSRNFERFSTIMHFGQFDSLLTKPADTQFLLSLWLINYTSIFRVLFGVLFTFHMLQVVDISFSFLSITEFVLFGICGLTVLYSMWFFAGTLIIWFTRLSNIIELLYSVTGMARYPKEMFQNIGGAMAFLLPLILVITTPTKALLQKVSGQDAILLMIFSIFLFILSRKFFLFALRFYTSASN